MNRMIPYLEVSRSRPRFEIQTMRERKYISGILRDFKKYCISITFYEQSLLFFFPYLNEATTNKFEALDGVHRYNDFE